VDRAATRSAAALKYDAAAAVAGAGAQVDDPVGVGHHGQVVLDHDDGLAAVDQPVQQAEQLLQVGKVQAGSGLVEHVDAAGGTHLRRELQAAVRRPTAW
jgi:hypothetical protein